MVNMKYCAVQSCSNGSGKSGIYKKSSKCSFHRFPTKHRNPGLYEKWVKAINRLDPKTGKRWEPGKWDRVCSRHFEGGKLSSRTDVPTLHLGYAPSKNPVPVRQPPKKRKVARYKASKASGKQTLAADTNATGEPTQLRSPRIMKKIVKPRKIKELFRKEAPNLTADEKRLHDHKYYYTCDCSPDCNCVGCAKKNNVVKQPSAEMLNLLQELQSKNVDVNQKAATMMDTCLKTNKSCSIFTGIRTVAQFNDLFSHLEKKAKHMRYWKGEKYEERYSSNKITKSSVSGFGPNRKLESKQEFLLVLIALRRGISTELLASLFGISQATASTIFNTWIKFMSFELQSLVYWPTRGEIRRQMPKKLRMCRNLLCTIDCTEVFIGCPRDREIQCLTWSDYKKHNTVKFLVAIAPNGCICYVSPVWGGKASDRQITLSDGFMDNIMPGDLVLADRGFTIKDVMIQRQATIDIPPSSSGVDQMSRADVKKTKHIASKRIHVERAIGRLKYFKILKHVLPVNLLPLIDDIVRVCACLTNLRPALV